MCPDKVISLLEGGAGDGFVLGEARGGDRRGLGHGPRAGAPAGGGRMLGRGLRLARGHDRGDRGAGARGRPAGRAGLQPCVRRLGRGAGAAVPRRAALRARQRSRGCGVQQRGHRGRQQLRHRPPGGLGAHVRRRLVGRVLLRPRVPAAAHRERRRGPGQHQQRERLLGDARPERAEQRLLPRPSSP